MDDGTEAVVTVTSWPAGRAFGFGVTDGLDEDVLVSQFVLPPEVERVERGQRVRGRLRQTPKGWSLYRGAEVLG